MRGTTCLESSASPRIRNPSDKVQFRLRWVCRLRLGSSPPCSAGRTSCTGFGESTSTPRNEREKRVESVARLVFGMNQSLDGYVDHIAFAPSPTLFRHFIEETQG